MESEAFYDTPWEFNCASTTKLRAPRSGSSNRERKPDFPHSKHEEARSPLPFSDPRPSPDESSQSGTKVPSSTASSSEHKSPHPPLPPDAGKQQSLIRKFSANKYPDVVRHCPPKPTPTPRQVDRNKENKRREKSTSRIHDIRDREDPVWKFRGPDMDDRNPADYEVPWDLKPREFPVKKEGRRRPVSEQVLDYETIWKTSDAIQPVGRLPRHVSANEDEERRLQEASLRNNNVSPNGSALRIRPISEIHSSRGHFSKPRVVSYANEHSPQVFTGSKDTITASPATSSTGSATGTKSTNSLSSTESSTQSHTLNDILPPGLTRPSPSHEFSKEDHENFLSPTTPAAPKTPITPLMETAFCTNSQNVVVSPREIAQRSKAEERQRRIQLVVLCGDTTLTSQPSSKGGASSQRELDKTSPLPVPAVRRSKLKAIKLGNDNTKKQDNPPQSHIIEIRGKQILLTAANSNPPSSSFPCARPATTSLFREAANETERILLQAHDPNFVFPTVDGGNPGVPGTTTKTSVVSVHNADKNGGITNGFNSLAANKFVTAKKSPGSCMEEYDVPWEFCSEKKLNRLMEKRGIQQEKAGETPLDRKSLSLNFGCSKLNPDGSNVDPEVPLQQQDWYHGSVTRVEAEQRLAKAAEGSYLVRICESNKEEYALSLKSAKGFMHMKIQQNSDKLWVLGYFSQPFESIPQMIRYYSINKLPIKGAEHMCLLVPLKDQLL